MKKFILLTAVLCLSVQIYLFASEGYVQVEGASRIISAYKNQRTGELPELSMAIRLLDSSDVEFVDNGRDLNLPVDARGSYYQAFSWVFSGNAFGQVTLTFSFARMTLNGANTNTQTEYIPYTVKMVYGSSKIGNSTIQMNTASTAQSYVSNSFTGTTYKMFYADSISGGAVASFATSGGESPANNGIGNAFNVALVYNMSSYTKVQNSNGQDRKQEYVNKVTQGNHANVCDYWNRSGTAYVKLLINNDRTWSSNSNIKAKVGDYRANVTVGVTVQ